MYRAPGRDDEAAVCLFCESMGRVDSRCVRCDAARASVDREPVMTRRCPRCATALLAIDIGAGASIHACATCKGMFLPPRAWAHVLAARELAARIEARLGTMPRRAVDTTASVACPTCRYTMDSARFDATSGVLLDGCRRGAHGVWLDASELRRIVAHHETPPHLRGPRVPLPDVAARRARGRHGALVALAAFVLLVFGAGVEIASQSARMQAHVDRAAREGERQLAP